MSPVSPLTSTTGGERDLQLGLGDVALLSSVQRPVPSLWRDAIGRLPDLPVP